MNHSPHSTSRTLQIRLNRVSRNQISRAICVAVVCVMSVAMTAQAHTCHVFGSLPEHPHHSMSRFGFDIDSERHLLKLPIYSPSLNSAPAIVRLGNAKTLGDQYLEPYFRRDGDRIIIELGAVANDPQLKQDTYIQVNLKTGEFRMDSRQHGEDVTTLGRYTYEALLANIMNNLPARLPHDRLWKFENRPGGQHRLLLTKPFANAKVEEFRLRLPPGVEAHFMGDRFLILRSDEGMQVGDHTSSAILLNLEEFLFDRNRFPGRYRVDIAEVTPVYDGDKPSGYKLLESTSIDVTNPQTAIDSKLNP